MQVSLRNVALIALAVVALSVAVNVGLDQLDPMKAATTMPYERKFPVNDETGIPPEGRGLTAQRTQRPRQGRPPMCGPVDRAYHERNGTRCGDAKDRAYHQAR